MRSSACPASGAGSGRVRTCRPAGSTFPGSRTWVAVTAAVVFMASPGGDLLVNSRNFTGVSLWLQETAKIGRASCRERVEGWEVAVGVKEKESMERRERQHVGVDEE